MRAFSRVNIAVKVLLVAFLLNGFNLAFDRGRLAVAQTVGIATLANRP